MHAECSIKTQEFAFLSQYKKLLHFSLLTLGPESRPQGDRKSMHADCRINTRLGLAFESV